MPGTGWEPKKIGDPLDPTFVSLSSEAIAGRLTFYVGAGVSRAGPTAMPTSPELIAGAAPSIAGSLGISVTDGDGTKTLEEIADEADSAGAAMLSAFKILLAEVPDLRRRPPNHSHLAIAALLREGVVAVLSVNWDLCFERGATRLGYPLTATFTEHDRRDRRWLSRLNKIHGCVTSPDTLRVTTAEISEPAAWAVAEVEYAIATGTIVFMGLGTVPAPLKARLQALVATSPTAVHVVSPTLSPEWSVILAVAPTQHHPMDANEFIDDLLRALARRVLAQGEAVAANVRSEDHARSEWSASGRALVEAFHGLPALPFLNWVRQAAGGVDDGVRVIATDMVTACLAALAGVCMHRTTTVEGRWPTLTVEVDGSYVELAAWPGVPAGQVVRAEEARTEQLREAGVYRLATAPVVHLSAGHIGRLPNPLLVKDLVGGLDPSSLVSGGAGTPHYWIPVDTYLQDEFEIPSWPAA